MNNGDPGVIRTRDLRIRSPALYPAELRGLDITIIFDLPIWNTFLHFV